MSAVRRVAIVVVVLVAGLALGTSGAAAYWSATGAGSGTSTSSSMQAPTVSAGTVTGPALYPGLSANGASSGATLSVTATNPNPFPITVTLAQDTSASVTGCSTPAVTFAGGTISVPANTTTAVTRTVAYSLGMGTGASNDCQGATLTVPLTTTSVSG